jgi:hypothetical protein
MRWTANPEILRQMWLELSPARLVSLPLILLAVFMLAWFLSDSFVAFLAGCRGISLAGLLLLPGIWGIRLVVDSLTREIHGRTWELQRMTPLSAWEMTLGKLVGGPIYAWYAGLLVMPPYLFSIWGLGTFPEGLRDLVNLLLGIVWFHGLSLVLALVGARKARAWNAEMPRSLPFYLAGAFGLLLWMVGGPVNALGGRWLVWYGIPWEHPGVLTGSLLFFAVWAVAGAHRCMRRELQVADVPWVWLLFLLTAMVYAAGMGGAPNEWESMEGLSGRLILAASVGILAAYVAMFAEVKDPVEERRLFAAAETGDWRSAAESLPLWVVPAGLTGGLCVLLTAAPVSGLSRLFPVVVYLFLLRDMGLILLANRVVRPRRADAAAVIWLLLLYVLCPMIAGAMTESKTAALLFLPLHLDGGMPQLIGVFLQTAAVAALLAPRLRRHPV